MLSTLSPDLAPISSSSHFYMAALNQGESGGDEDEGSHPPDGNGHFETDPEKMGRSPVKSHWRRGHQKSSALLQQRILMIP